MADVQLTRREIAGGLPPVCLQCGGTAATEVSRKLHDAHLPSPILPEDPVGCVLFPISLLMMLGVKAARNDVIVTMPLCRRHAKSWFNWSAPELKSVDGEYVTLSGVSEEFIAALAERRRATDSGAKANGESSDQIIKVRCQRCQALNDESARFCNQCGAEL